MARPNQRLTVSGPTMWAICDAVLQMLVFLNENNLPVAKPVTELLLRYQQIVTVVSDTNNHASEGLASQMKIGGKISSV